MKTKWIIICILVVMTLLACPQGIIFDEDTTVTDDQVDMEDSVITEDPVVPEEAAKNGELTIQVPRFSSYLAEAMGLVFTEPATTSRSFLIVSKVDFYLYDAGSTLIDTLYYTTPFGPDTQNGDTIATWGPIPSATGYTIRADVYNSAVSDIDYLLSGISDPFDVTSGNATEVWIRPIPVADTSITTVVSAADTPVALPDAAFTSTFWDGVTVQTVIIDYGADGVEGGGDDTTQDYPVYTWGKEHWFKIDNSVTGYDAMRLTATPDASSAAVMMIADSTGDTMTMAMSGNSNPQESSWIAGEDATLAFLSPGDTYYVGMITVNNDAFSINSTVDLSFTQFTEVDAEENDTTLTATAIAKGNIMSGTDLDPIQWGWPSTGGDLYTFTVTADEDPTNIDIYLVFDHDQGNLFVALYDSSGSELVWADNSTGDGTTALEQETILMPDDYATLTIGDTYYILVGTNNGWPVGNSYQLQWVSGEGSANIGLQ